MSMPQTPNANNPQPPPVAQPNNPNPQPPPVAQPNNKARAVVVALVIGVCVLLAVFAGINKHLKNNGTPQIAAAAPSATTSSTLPQNPARTSAPSAPAQPAPPARQASSTPAPPTQAPVAPTPASPLTAEEAACAAAHPLPNTFSCPAGRTCIASFCRRGVVCGTTLDADRFCAERIRSYETQAAVNNGAYYAYYDGTTALRPASTPERWDVNAAALVY